MLTCNHNEILCKLNIGCDVLYYSRNAWSKKFPPAPVGIAHLHSLRISHVRQKQRYWDNTNTHSRFFGENFSLRKVS